MIRSLNPNILMFLVFFGLFRFVDADLIFKGTIFIFISVILIYSKQRHLNYLKYTVIISLILTFTILDEKKIIEEISSPLKLSKASENIYKNILGEQELAFIKPYYISNLPSCYENIINCFQNDKIESIYVSPDQILFNINKEISRKVNSVEFSNLANARLGFVNYVSGNINHNKINKLNTPFYVEYKKIDHLSGLCFKGFAFIEFISGDKKGLKNNNNHCINEPIKKFIGFSLPDNNLEVYSNESGLSTYFDEVIIILFLIFLILNIDKYNLKKDLRLLIPVLISIFVIFYISRFDNWFEVFNLFTFYFFGFEGGDGNKYINLSNIMFINLLNSNLSEVIRGGEDIFNFTPGLRYFLLVCQIFSGDFYYLYFFTLFFIPKVVYKFIKIQFGKKIGYIVILSFLIFPILHHLGFSYYQFIRHAYRLYPEPLGYMFFIAGLSIFFTDFEKNFIKMNLLFALSVIIRPNLILSIIFIVLLKMWKEKINILEIKNLFFIPFIGLIYLFPLFHNLYFGDSFTLFTSYGQKMLSFAELHPDDDPRYDKAALGLNFYLNKILSINFLFFLLIFIPKLNFYLKTILLSQYLTLFYFDENGRYYWIYWLVSLNLIHDTLVIFYKKKWQYLKKYISN